MDIKERISDEHASRHAWLLLFAFICGALLTLVYLPGLLSVESFGLTTELLCMSLTLLLSAALSSSVCGAFYLPLIFAALGVVTAFGANAALEEFQACREACLKRTLTIFVLVPLNFSLGVWGMCNSLLLRRAVSKEGSIGKGRYRRMYFWMTATALGLLLTVILSII